MQIVTLPITDLQPADYNPRKASVEEYEQVKRSIQMFGLVEPLIVNSHPDRKNVVVGGHLRLQVCKDLGYTEMPVVYVDLEEAKERELNVRLNKNTGSFDWEKLVQEFEEPFLLDVGFTLKELHTQLTPGGGGVKDGKEVECPACGEKFVPVSVVKE